MIVDACSENDLGFIVRGFRVVFKRHIMENYFSFEIYIAGSARSSIKLETVVEVNNNVKSIAIYVIKT